MKVRAIFRFRKVEPQKSEPQKALLGNAPSVTALCLSGLLHIALIAAAFLGAAYFPADTPRTLYAQIIAPEEKKIVWYPLRDLRIIAPTQRIGTAPVPQGQEKRNQTIVRDDPEAKPGKQFLWRPDSAKKIEQEIPAPNMVAVEAPPEPPKPRNVFHVPAPAPVIEQPAAALPAPPAPSSGLSSAPPQALPTVLAAMPKVTRRFVAPPPQDVHRPKPDDTAEPPPVQTADVRAVVNPSNGALDSLLEKGPALPRRQFVPPSVTKGSGSPGGSVKLPELDGAPMAESVNAAVLSTAPLDKLLTSIPEGSRSVRMSAAPTQGSPSSGPVKAGAGLRIPGVAVATGTAPPGGPPAGVPKPSPRPVRTVYEETRTAVQRTSLSAPLRPSSRIIPQPIESRFHDRVAYSIIISRPPLPVYAGDWVLWFAEKLPAAISASQMRAPQPLRKTEALDEEPEPSLAGRVQFAATILRNGQIDSVVVLSGASNALSQAAAIRDLRNWQFAPALRNGEAVDVEVVVEIPFQRDNTTISTGPTRH